MANPLMQMLSGMMGGGTPQMGNNPMMMLINLMKNGGNPQSLISMLSQQNPEIKEMMTLLEGKNPQDLENICKNLCQKKGIDFNSAMSQIQNMMK